MRNENYYKRIQRLLECSTTGGCRWCCWTRVVVINQEILEKVLEKDHYGAVWYGGETNGYDVFLHAGIYLGRDGGRGKLEMKVTITMYKSSKRPEIMHLISKNVDREPATEKNGKLLVNQFKDWKL